MASKSTILRNSPSKCVDLDMVNKINEYQLSTVFYNMLRKEVKTQSARRWLGRSEA